MDARTVLLRALDERWNKYRSEFKTCRNEFSEEAVHDLRVSARRLLAVFNLLRSIVHHARIQKIRRTLKDQLDDLDDLRDVQVLIADISEFVHELSEFENFRAYLQKKEKKFLREARKLIQSHKLDAFEKRVERTRKLVEELPKRNFDEQLLESLDEAFTRVTQYYVGVDAEKTITIHKLRIALKKFRYMIEIANPLFKNFPLENFQRMHDYQGAMGDIQDMEIAIEQLDDFAESDSSLNLKTVREHYTSRFKKSLSAYIDDKGEVLNFWRSSPEKSFPWEN